MCGPPVPWSPYRLSAICSALNTVRSKPQNAACCTLPVVTLMCTNTLNGRCQQATLHDRNALFLETSNMPSAIQQIPRPLRKPKVHYRVHNSPRSHPVFNIIVAVPLRCSIRFRCISHPFYACYMPSYLQYHGFPPFLYSNSAAFHISHKSPVSNHSIVRRSTV